VTDHRLGDAFFLSAHPSWSQHDLDTAEQDIVDYLSAIQHEQARHSQQERLQSQREQWAARNRVRV
jgi:hypothetical protein